MEMTPIRVAGATVASCLIVAVAILGGGSPMPSATKPEREFSLREGIYREHANALAARLRLAQLIDSTRLATAPERRNLPPIRVIRDGAIKGDVRADLDSLGWRAVRAVRDSGRMGLDIIFLYDTVGALNRTPVHRYGATVDYVLPKRADERCTVLVRFGNDPSLKTLRTRVFSSTAASDQLLGPCAYYRAFGMPGTEVARWLGNRGWAYANRGSWRTSAPQIDLIPPEYRTLFNPYWISYNELSVDGVQCNAGDLEACTRALERPRVSSIVWNTNILTKPFPSLALGGPDWRYRSDFGRREGFLLADMVRTLGPTRFAAFWTANESVPAAFEKAAGEPIGKWTSRWVGAQYGPADQGPGVSIWTVAVSALLCVLAIFIALRIGANREYA